MCLRNLHGYALLFAVALVTSLASPSAAQIAATSGVPGDGIPDIYYFPQAGSVETSAGVITRVAGVMTVDTDGTDMVAVRIGGPNALETTPDIGTYMIGTTANLPDPNAPPPLFASSWEVEYENGSTAWIRTSPLNTEGFRGVICEPIFCYGFALWPHWGLGNFGPGKTASDFTGLFEDPASGAFFNVAYSTFASGDILTNVTIVPEPGGLLLLLSGLVLARRRIQISDSDLCPLTL